MSKLHKATSGLPYVLSGTFEDSERVRTVVEAAELMYTFLINESMVSWEINEDGCS